MTGLVRKATLLAALGLVVATSAMAGIPVAANCDWPAYIKVVGTASGNPDPGGTFTITIRDIAPAPIPNCLVQLDFTTCTDMRLCSGTGVACGPATVSTLTDVNGVATFTVVGGGINSGLGLPTVPSITTPCVNIYANGQLIGTAKANVYDQNGALAGGNGVDILDLSPWLADWGRGVYLCRSDYDQNGVLDILDMSPWLALWGLGRSSGGCATTYCP